METTGMNAKQEQELDWTGSLIDRLNELVRENTDYFGEVSNGAEAAKLIRHIHGKFNQLRMRSAELQRENTALRALVVKHECPYGHRLPDGVCKLGYPGCACADDAVCHADETMQRIIKERDALRAQVQELREVLEQIAKPALGGKLQQYAARAALAKLDGQG